jgi:hypothetical protein
MGSNCIICFERVSLFTWCTLTQPQASAESAANINTLILDLIILPGSDTRGFKYIIFPDFCLPVFLHLLFTRRVLIFYTVISERTENMKIAIAQINPKVGDIAGNAALVETFARRAEVLGADLAVFPGAGPDRLSAAGPG